MLEKYLDNYGQEIFFSKHERSITVFDTTTVLYKMIYRFCQNPSYFKIVKFVFNKIDEKNQQKSRMCILTFMKINKFNSDSRFLDKI